MNKTELNEKRIEVWRRILKPDQSWVLFENGTCVIWDGITDNPETYGINLLKAYGFVVPGTPAGDFNQKMMGNPPGMLVTYHHEHIMSFLLEEELDDPGVLSIPGIIARHRRELDAKSLVIVHIESNE